tara:strand:- start:404 stop:1180 length:777 start_codon:yes stop_codon:yes gene_type:complete
LKWLKGILDSSSKEYGNIVYFTEDEYGKLLVIDYGETRTLNFDSPFEQSSMLISQPHQLAHPYTQLMLLVLAFIQPSHITLFGLGGGSMLRALHHILPNCFFKTLELRQKVVDIAYEYFDIPQNDLRVEIIVNDVLKEVENCESNSTNIIFSDMYDAYQMIPEQIQKEFLESCSRLLTSNGWLVINLHKLPLDETGFYDLLLESFPTVIMSTNKTNTILYLSNSKPESINTNLQLLKKAEVLLKQDFIPLMHRLKLND